MITLHIIVTDLEDEIERLYLSILSPNEKNNKEKKKIMDFLKKSKDLCKTTLLK